MPKQKSAARRKAAAATRDDIRDTLGVLEDETVLEILALEPTVADIEEAALWDTGNGEALGGRKRATGVVGAIVEILQSEEEEPPSPRGTAP